MSIQKNRKILKGIVVSDKMSKTIVVKVTTLKPHRKLKQFYKVSRKYKAHDETSSFKAGDKVIIQSSRPISKDKRWVVIKKIENRI